MTWDDDDLLPPRKPKKPKKRLVHRFGKIAEAVILLVWGWVFALTGEDVVRWFVAEPEWWQRLLAGVMVAIIGGAILTREYWHPPTKPP